MYRLRVDLLAIVGVLLILFMSYNVVRDAVGASRSYGGRSAQIAAHPTSISLQQNADGDSASGVAANPEVRDPLSKLRELDQGLFLAPYDGFDLTQGPHGMAYGHLAIDITGGKEAVILSPINGLVTSLFVDDIGNTTLIIENDRYQVMMLHGLYSVAVGDLVHAGQPVGVESNQGNTVDAYGRSCRGRDCGYHTHLNVYDKTLGSNVNPLELLSTWSAE